MSVAQLPSLLTAPGGRASQPLPRQGYKLPHMLRFSFSFTLRLFIPVPSYHFSTFPFIYLLILLPLIPISIFSLSLIHVFAISSYICEFVCAFMGVCVFACLFILTSLEWMEGGGECLARRVLADVHSAVNKSSLYSRCWTPHSFFLARYRQNCCR